MVEDTCVQSPNQKKSEKIRIILADDHPLIRQATRMWLEKQQDMEVIAEAKDGKEAVAITTKLHPDIVILDLSMPKLNGLEATRQIISNCHNTKILALTVHSDDEHVLGMRQAGVSGYLTKDVLGEEIVHAVRAIISGESVLPSVASKDNLDESLPRANKAVYNKLNELNSRELTILKLVAKGMSNKDIALKMGLSLRVVKANLTVIFLKTGTLSRTEAVSIGLKNGTIKIDDLK